MAQAAGGAMPGAEEAGVQSQEVAGAKARPKVKVITCKPIEAFCYQIVLCLGCSFSPPKFAIL